MTASAATVKFVALPPAAESRPWPRGNLRNRAKGYYITTVISRHETYTPLNLHRKHKTNLQDGVRWYNHPTSYHVHCYDRRLHRPLHVYATENQGRASRIRPPATTDRV
ncbi:hypothetical protein CCHR01_12918 [Colletotrichum chrysophilum]|uniref:Uncharacterized protein n=1 Tax=Colletotrichum chrysophilum TaxID=1836956 RepID=A0AAD9ABN0_9PEZI|nr:hypothetical protein CCHR01_12918 [Colletotrichum chrysophilum]